MDQPTDPNPRPSPNLGPNPSPNPSPKPNPNQVASVDLLQRGARAGGERHAGAVCALALQQLGGALVRERDLVLLERQHHHRVVVHAVLLAPGVHHTVRDFECTAWPEGGAYVQSALRLWHGKRAGGRDAWPARRVTKCRGIRLSRGSHHCSRSSVGGSGSSETIVRSPRRVRKRWLIRDGYAPRYTPSSTCEKRSGGTSGGRAITRTHERVAPRKLVRAVLARPKGDVKH